jgi:Nucleotidyltransferase domain
MSEEGTNSMSNPFSTYITNREDLLIRIATVLKSDQRFVAAWLTGSYGRGEQNEMSDIDVRVVVADEYSESLCARPWPHGRQTTDERLALFSQFGTPAVIYEAHGNAPEGGTFTYVLYREIAINVDWILVPQSNAQRARDTRLLFDNIGIPLEAPAEPESLEERITTASDSVSFFWMIAFSSLKYLALNDIVHFHMLQDWLHEGIHEVERLLDGRVSSYHAGSYARLAVTSKEQIAAHRALCQQMLKLMPRVIEMGGSVPTSPMPVIEVRLAMIEALFE